MVAVGPWLRAMCIVVFGASLFAGEATAQPEVAPFGPSRGGSVVSRAIPGHPRRPFAVERQFLAAHEDWTFYHSFRDVPSDMRIALFRAAGTEDVVGPGEPMDLSDIALHSGRVQHLYTATTEDLGVVVWHSGGSLGQGHILLYDRKVGDACRYELIRHKGAVLPLESLIRQRIENYGQKLPRCDYLGADYFR